MDEITAFRSRVANLEEQPEWLEPHEVADLIGVTPLTLKNWRRKGWGPMPWKQGSGATRYTKFEVKSYLHSIERGQTPRWDPKTMTVEQVVPLKSAQREPKQPKDDRVIREERESIERLQRLIGED